MSHLKKYAKRPSPPYPANECPNQIRIGNDGNEYVSKSDKRGIFAWKKVPLNKSFGACPREKKPKKNARKSVRKSARKSSRKPREWYVGDPCYVIDEDWHDFVDATFDKKNQSRATNFNMDSVIDWNGARIEIWSNGGDGAWSWKKPEFSNKDFESFSVDAGIFAVIPFDCLRKDQQEEARSIIQKKMAIGFKGQKPRLYVEDGIVYLNDEPADTDDDF